jgi:pyrroloquinoline quinone biosynthesis protein A
MEYVLSSPCCAAQKQGEDGSIILLLDRTSSEAASCYFLPIAPDALKRSEYETEGASHGPLLNGNAGSLTMKWVKPDFCDVRLGFEVTAYVFVR